MRNRILSNWLRAIGGRSMHPSIPFEEVAPDLVAVTTTRLADLLGVIEMDLSELEPRDSPRFFVDGVQRSAIVEELYISIPPTPVVASHIAVGAFTHEANKVKPVITRDVLLILLPRSTLMQLPNAPSELSNVPIPMFDNTGNFYVKACQSQLREGVNVFLVDSSLTFQRNVRVTIQESELAAVGKIRQTALNRINAVRRALEFGIVSELRKRYPDDLIVVDGPLARMMFLIYARLADTRLEYLEDLADVRRSYEFLSRIVGIVKVVKQVPQSGLEHAFDIKDTVVNVPVFRFTDSSQIRDEESGRASSVEEEFRHLICCFVWLRPELREHIPVTGSITGGLVRIDIPIPAIIDYDPQWASPGFQIDISDGRIRARIEQILRGILAERLPLPPLSRVHKMFTELYTISEAERLLRSNLLTPEDMRLIIRKI